MNSLRAFKMARAASECCYVHGPPRQWPAAKTAGGPGAAAAAMPFSSTGARRDVHDSKLQHMFDLVRSRLIKGGLESSAAALEVQQAIGGWRPQGG